MDNNSPTPGQTPPPEAPTPTSLESTPTTEQPATPITPPTAPTGTPAPQPPKKLGTGAIAGIIGGIILVVLLIVGSVLIANSLNNKNSDTSADKQNSSKTTDADTQKSDLRKANAIAADSLTDFSTVCDNGSVKNAAAYEKPYKVAAFDNNTTRKNWSGMTLSYDNTAAVKYADFAQANVVACLDRDDSTAVKAMTCDFKSSGETTSVDYYAVSYKVTLHEAQSGKVVKELGTVNGPATKCPSFVTYNKSDPKIYGSPDKADFEAKFAEFAQ